MRKVIEEKISDRERNLVERFFAENQRLVNKHKRAGQDSNYLGEVRLAVVRAAQHYNASEGRPFANYANTAIKHAVWKASSKDKVTRIPKKRLSDLREHSRKLIEDSDSLPFDILPDGDDDGSGAGTCVPVFRTRSPEVNARCHEILDIVRESLPPQYAEILWLFVQGYKTREIASELGENHNTIRSRLVRAREKLKQDPRMAEYWGLFSAKRVPSPKR